MPQNPPTTPAPSGLHLWRVIKLLVAIAFAGVICGFLIGRKSQSWSSPTESLAKFSKAAAEGRTCVYTWRGSSPSKAAGKEGTEIKGEVIYWPTGYKKMIDGREFHEIEFSYKNVPFPSGVCYDRVTDNSVESSFAVPKGWTGAHQITTQVEFPLEVGKEWVFLGASKCKVLRFGKYRDASGKVWDNACSIGIFLAGKSKGEMWFHPDVGMLAAKLFLPELGELELQLKEVL
jgi:hypothetical protein